MPSGSHGGGGGSHGGGHSGGGRSGGYSHSRGGYNRPPRPVRPFRFHWGHTVYVIPSESRSKISGLFFTCLIFAFFVLASVFMLVVANQEVKYIKSDREGYLAMIRKAQTNEELVVEGTVLDVWQDDGNPSKWYITYKFTASDGSVVDNGYSFSVYNSRAEAPSEGEKIKLAVPSAKTNKMSDSVPMDYITYGIEEDAGYISAMNSLKLSRNITIVFACFSGMFLILGIITIFKSKKREDQLKTATVNSAPTPAHKPNTCDYCGGRVSSSDKFCPSCGARVDY